MFTIVVGNISVSYLKVVNSEFQIVVPTVMFLTEIMPHAP